VTTADSIDKTKIRMAMAVSALMMAHQVAGKAARDGIFLSQFSTSALPRMVAAAALVAVVSSVLRGRTLVRMGPQRITAISFGISGVLQAGEWVLLRYHPQIASCAIYLHVVAFGAILLSGYWSLMNEAFDPREAKRVFGQISGMGTLGGLAGGILASRVAAWVSVPAVVLMLAVLHLLCAALLRLAFPYRAAAARDSEPRSTATARQALERYPFLLTLAGMVLAASAGTALLDFVFKSQAAQTFGKGSPLLEFFGLYYTGTSLLIFLVQTFVTRYVVQHAGLAASSAALPASIAAGSAAAFLIPGFGFLGAVRGLEILMRGSIFRSAYELFYTAVAPSDKRAVKSVIDVGADRLGDAIGAGAVALLLMLLPGRSGAILAAACVCSGFAVLLSVQLRNGYVRALEKSLVNRAIELDPAMAQDSTTLSVLMQTAHLPNTARSAAPAAPASALRGVQSDSFLRTAGDLRSGDAPRAAQAAGRLGPQDWALAPLLIDLLAWDPATQAARDALSRMGPKITGMLVDVLTDSDRDFTIRRRVPRVLAFVASSRSVEGLFAALEDVRFEVRFYCGRALYLLLRDHPELSVAPERIWAAVNRELSVQKSVWRGHHLLDSRDSRDADWFFDPQLQGRADRNLEHLFTLLSLLLPADAVRIAFRALHTDDRQLKATAFEYLESATPPATRRPLLQLLEADAESRQRSATPDAALDRLMQSQAHISRSLSLPAHPAKDTASRAPLP
jgi:AAA family ATP:ADP antiporter